MTYYWRFTKSVEHLGEPLSTSYDPLLAVLSIIVACLAAYSGLAVVNRMNEAKTTVSRGRWLVLGALTMGAGVWAMHFVAMLAFTIPVNITYSIPWTTVSVVPAILGSGVALFIITRPHLQWQRVQAGALLMAVGIGSMHYLGMAAMRLNALMIYDLTLLISSVLAAHILAALSLHMLSIFRRSSAGQGFMAQLYSSVLMGFSVAAMHYIAMLSVSYFAATDSVVPVIVSSQTVLGIATSVIAIIIIAIVIISTMIDRRLARAADTVRASDQLSRVILDSVSEGVIGQDLQGKVTFVNSGAATMLGYRPEELIGLSPGELPQLAGDSAQLESIGEDSIFDAYDCSVAHEASDLVLMRRDGSIFPAHCSKSAIKIDGRIDGSVVTFRDITANKINEQALIKARAQAEAASEAKSDFLARMSHEIRTPMNGVLGMTELLLKTELGRRQQHLAQTARRSAESLLGIIDNILDFSKIEAGHAELMDEDFQLRALLEDVVELVADQAHRKGLELLQDTDLDLPEHVRGDAMRLRQVLTNLLGNAIKFTDEGEVDLKTTLVEESSAEVTLHFEITDTGPGIALHRQKNIFDEFIQEDGSISRQHGGTGLGLAISQRILRLMGSELILDSTPGEGACFSFTVTLAPGRRIHTAENVTIDVLAGVRALIVDDNANNRHILHSQIMNWGMRNGSVASGEEALNRLREAATDGDPYEVALLDWYMPEMDGITLAHAINADSTIPPLHLVMLSSGTADISSAVGAGAGITSMLRKPVRQQQLQDCLCKLFGAKPVPQAKPLQQSSDLQSQGGRILLAEDNLVNQEVALGMLEDLRCDVDVVENGEQAITAFTDAHYDLILMDCHMPKLDGFAATKAIRKLEQERGISPTPIVAITADIKKGITDQCIEAGMDAYLSKPFGMENLNALLCQWLPDASEPATAHADEIENTSVTNTACCKIDQKTIEDLRRIGGKRGTNLLEKVTGAYRKQAPQLLAEAREAWSEQRFPQLFDAAHSLKSCSANIGALNFSALCAQLETQSRSNTPDSVPELLESITELLPEVIGELIRLTENSAVSVAANPVGTEQKQTILIVDDDSSFRMILQNVLIDEGFNVIEAGNGEQAIASVQRNNPDLILLDAIMDGINGFEVCQQLTNSQQFGEIPVLMVTGLDDLESINSARQAGASGFVTKPVNFPILVQQLHFVLRASELKAQSEEKQARLEAAQRLARIGYWNWDVRGGEFEMSRQLADLLEIKLDTFGGDLESYIQLVHKDDRRHVRTILDNVLTDGLPHACDYRLVGNNGVSIIVRQDFSIKMHTDAVSFVFGAVQDITRQQEAEDRIRKLAYFDNLTGLGSRSYLMQHLSETIKSAHRREETFALLFLDLDGFKDINDSMGHDIGDRLLQIVARRLQQVLREGDFVARLGGDEFCMIIKSLPDQFTMAEVAQRCLDVVGEPLELLAQRIEPQMSIGIAHYPNDGNKAHSLLKAADSAMYAAKKAGKNQYAFYSPKMTEEAQIRLEMDSSLRMAFENNEFVLHYQPQISLGTGRVTGIEALVRWQHPQRGLIAPKDFLPAVERIGKISDLGDLVINKACEQLRQWQIEKLPSFRMSINVAPVHFCEPTIGGKILSALHKNSLQPDDLQLEITEAVLQNEPEVREVMQHLTGLGIKLAIDDFGTGYSSLGSLKNLPIHQLKIDRTFVRDMIESNEDAVLLGTIVGLAHALGLTVVAEGVEDLTQLQILTGIDCDIVQGYYFSKPVEASKIPALLRQSFLPNTDYRAQAGKVSRIGIGR